MKLRVFKIIFVCFGILTSFIFCNKTEDIPPHVIAGENFMERMQIKLAKKHNLICRGTSKGMIKTINLMGFIFRHERKVTKDEGRRIFVDCVNEFLDAINEDESLRPYLAVYPFDFNHIDMTIHFNNENHDDLFHPDLGAVTNINNNIRYYTYDSECQIPSYKVDERESFEDALKIVNGQMDAPPSSIR